MISQPMLVIPVTAMTDAILNSSTVAEPDAGETAWNIGTVYAIGDVCYLAATHRRYQSRTAGNVGNDPTGTTVEEPSTNWRDIGATNRWAMFDLASSSVTTAASPLVIELEPGERFDALALAGLLADSITVAVTRGVDTIYSDTRTLRSRQVTGWYQYFHTRFDYVKRAAFFDIPPYTDSVVTITLTRSVGDIEVQACGFGMAEEIGVVVKGANVGRISFSRVDRNTFADVQLNRRRAVPKMSLGLHVEKVYVPRITTVLDNLDATVAFWVGMNESTHPYFEPLFLVGFPRTWSFDLVEEQHAALNLEIEEI